MHNFDLHSHRHPQFCNHYAARNPQFLKDQEGISSSEENPNFDPQQGFHRHYLAERSATMFNPCTGEIPGFATSVTTSSAARAHSSYVTGSPCGGVNKAALYSASYHHFSTFSNSSIPSEENSPTHQHFPLTGSSSSTSHSLSDHTSGENGGGGGGVGGSGNESKPPLPPKKSRSILKGLLGDLSRDSSQETEKSNGVVNTSNGSNGYGVLENNSPSQCTTPLSPTSPILPTNLPINANNKAHSSSPVKTSQTPTSPVVPNPVPVNSSEAAASSPTASTNNNATTVSSNNGNEGSSKNNGSTGKSPQRSLDDDSIDLFMIDPTPLLVINKNPPPTKPSPPTSTSSNSNSNNGKNSTKAENINSKRNSNTEGQLEVKGAEPLVLLVYAASPDVVGESHSHIFHISSHFHYSLTHNYN